MPRFVILSHDWPTPHWDLLLEAGPVLKAWRLLSEPVPEKWIPAERNADHRLMYLEYEGPLSGNRGSVRRWDAGDFDGAVEGDCWRIRVRGSRLRGTAEMASDGGEYRFRVSAGQG